MRRIVVSCLVAFSMLCAANKALAQDVKPVLAKVPAELQPFEGVWKPESIQFDGLEVADKKTKEQIRLSIESGQYKLFSMTDAKKGIGVRLATCSMTVDSAKKQLLLTFLDGPRRGEKLHGIYEVSGKELKVCYVPTDKPMPTKFAAPKDSGVFCETWSKEK